jgi:uridine kinase
MAVVSAVGADLASMTESVGLLLAQRSLPRRAEVNVKLDGESLRVRTGATAASLMPPEIDGHMVVAALKDDRPVSLDTPMASETTLAPITTESWEGRQIVRRSAGLALLEVARAVAPSLRLRLGGSLTSMQCIESDGPIDDAERLASELSRGLATLVARGEAFREEVWGVDEAAAHLREQGWEDAVRLLRSSRQATVVLVSCGDVYAPHMGPCVRRTSDLGDVKVVARGGRLFLDFGNEVRSQVPGGLGRDPLEVELKAPRYGSEMSLAARNWLEAMGVTDVGAFNERCVEGRVSRIIRAAEGFHEKRLSAIADAIAARRDQVRIICVAGPSSSGKTTFLKRLTVQLEIDGILPVGISLDDYYVDREKTPRDEKGDYDFEAIEALQLDRLQRDVAALLEGKKVRLPRYDFPTGRSIPDGGSELELHPGEAILIEGIHALNPALLGAAVAPGQTFRIFIHPATILDMDPLVSLSPVDVRLLRRIVRDRHGRSFTAADSIARWASVRRGEALHIYPHLPQADVVFDSFLPYEPSVLKVYAERYLLEVPRSHPSFPTAYRLRHLIDRFVTIYPDHVPPTSSSGSSSAAAASSTDLAQRGTVTPSLTSISRVSASPRRSRSGSIFA